MHYQASVCYCAHMDRIKLKIMYRYVMLTNIPEKTIIL